MEIHRAKKHGNLNIRKEMWNTIGMVYVSAGVIYLIGRGSLNRQSEKRSMIVQEVGILMLIGGMIELYGKGIGREMNVYQNEELGRIVRSLMLISGGMSLIGLGRNMKKDRHEYGVIVILSIIGLCISVSSGDMVTIYLGIELSALGMYTMVSYSKRSSYSSESGIKYYIIGSVSTGITLYGMSKIYRETGTLRLEEIGELSRSYRIYGGEISEDLKIGIWLIVVGMMFKVGGVPFHMWMVDVVEGSNVRSGRIMSIVPKVGILSILIRIKSENIVEEVGDWIRLISIMTMIVGVVGAYKQRRVKRFIGYSSIGHIGYMLIGVGMVKEEGIRNVISYGIVYIVSGYVIWSICEREGIKYIEEIGRRGKENKWLGSSILIINMTMAGIPPIYGFKVKMDLIKGILNEGEYVWSTIGMMCTVLGCYNYLRWVKVIYYDREERREERRKEEKRRERSGMESMLISGIGIGLVSKTPLEMIW